MKKLLFFLLLTTLSSCTDKSLLRPIRQLGNRLGITTADSAYVDTYSNQVVAGEKTFSDTTRFSKPLLFGPTATFQLDPSGYGLSISAIADGGIEINNTSTAGSSFFYDAADRRLILTNSAVDQSLLIFPAGTRSYTFPSISGTVSVVVSANAPLDFPNIPAGTRADLTVLIPTTTSAEAVVVGIPNSIATNDNLQFKYWLNGPVLTLRIINTGATDYDPMAYTYKIRVVK